MGEGVDMYTSLYGVCMLVPACACVCVCERERERKREGGESIVVTLSCLYIIL